MYFYFVSYEISCIFACEFKFNKMIYSIETSLEITKHPIFFIDEERAFKTSLNIIGEVMNVPMCALSSILRANGYEEVASDSICIDEKMLSFFADAYIRKMKNYFLSSIRNIENLTYQEFTDLNEFYNTFKKQDVKIIRKAEWSHIDTGLLRDAFMDKIKELTPRRKSRFELYLESLLEKYDDEAPCVSIGYREYKEHDISLESPSDILYRVSHNRYYIAKQKLKKTYRRSVDVLRQLYVAARYHIFVDDDVDSNERVFQSKKSTLLYYIIKNNKYKQYEHRTTHKSHRSKQSSRRRQAYTYKTS